MKNMKVSLKLAVSFTIVIVLAAVVGGIGIFGMYSINAADDDLYTGNYLPSVLAGDISQQVVEQRTHARSIVLFDIEADAASFQQAVADMDANRAEMEAMLAEYADSITEQDDQEAYDALVDEYRNMWNPAVDNIITLGTANRNEEAKAALVAAAPVALDLDELTAQLQRINMDDGKIAVDANTSLFTTMTIIEIGILLLSIAIAIFLALHLTRLIASPLGKLTNFMVRAGGSGDLSMSAEDTETIKGFAQVKDEIGQCIGSTTQFINHVVYIAEELERAGSGDLTHDVNSLSDKDVMGVSMRNMLKSLNSSFGQINIATAQVAQGSQQIANAAQSLAQGSTEQAATVEELSASTSEIATKTKENARMAENAADMAETIKQNAQKGSALMNDMMSAVNDITQASQSIGRVIKVIDDIAFQTNILALNAAVEAARAGQHGKGFAVVSEEVRNLAAKSAEAAKDTGELIQNSIAKAELGAKIAKETAASLDEIVSGINENGQIISQIASSSEEQSGGVVMINTGIDQVTQVVQQNSATAEESAAASEELSSQAALLERLIGQFKLKGGESRAYAADGAGDPYAADMGDVPDRSNVRAFTLNRGGDKY